MSGLIKEITNRPSVDSDILPNNATFDTVDTYFEMLNIV
jgi:hypothetical protein